MARILVLYGTTDGHTAKVASEAADVLRAEGHRVELVEAAKGGGQVGAADFDGVLVAASVHVGGFQRQVVDWVRAHVRELADRPAGFFAVCLGILQKTPEAERDLDRVMGEFLERTGWRPTFRRFVAGAIPYTRYGWIKKRVMRRIARKQGGGTDTRRDYVYTDWDELRKAARAFAEVASPGLRGAGAPA